jgi:hypothetical protein
MYGHIPVGLDDLATITGSAIVLDLAQGLMLADAAPLLMKRADAVVYSFGIGKGFDTRGGLLGVRQTLGASETIVVNPLLTTAIVDMVQIIGLRAAIKIGLYAKLLPFFEHKLESDKADMPSTFEGTRSMILARNSYFTWAARLPTLSAEIAVARRRAATLFATPALAGKFQYAAVYGGARASHLRQIVRLADRQQRDLLLAALRLRNIDAMPAGEPMPGEYLDAAKFDSDRSGFPNAGKFRADAIRLPYLGRLNENSYDYLLQTLEKCLA